MSSQVMPRALAAGAVIAAAGLVLLTRPSNDEPTLSGFDSSTPPAPLELAATQNTALEPPPETAARAKLRELETMSETFRNTTFLIAIRDAGFACNELLRVYGGLDGSAQWMATCSEMHAYTVSVESTGALRVSPTLQYFDGLTPSIQQELEPSSVPEPNRNPRTLPPQQPR